MAKPNTPAIFGPTFPGNYPEPMRRQMWPLCCGASIISGFKQVNTLTDDELVEQIEATMKSRPDFQIYAGETMNPALTFLTLNSGQMESKKIMAAIAKCGFKKIADAKPRGGTQGFFLKDTSKTWTPCAA